MVLGFMTEIFSLVFLSTTHSSGHICICYVMTLKKDIKTVMQSTNAIAVIFSGFVTVTVDADVIMMVLRTFASTLKC